MNDVSPRAARTRHLATLLGILATLSPRFGREETALSWSKNLRAAMAARSAGDDEGLEQSVSRLYCLLHGKDAGYTREERGELEATEGYWCYAGGLEPLFMAGEYVGPDTVSADLGAGNGLQGLLLQVLFPHRKTVQVELSARMIDRGRKLQKMFGVPDRRIEWVRANIRDVDIDGIDFVYMYRPARPVGQGRALYRDLARKLEAVTHPVTFFSVADCLGEFLGSSVSRVRDDGHLVVYRHEPGGRTRSLSSDP